MSPREFLNGRVVLHPGDCMKVLPTLEAESVDSVVTDPPYHLTSIVKRFGKEGSAPAQFGTDGAFARASRGFMGKQWDGGDIAFRPELWVEVLRVLKPGGHLLAFSGSRTYHRMACAIEDAGFEIRDQIMWLYGSGFPKSHDVSKAIDRVREDNADWRRVGKWLREQREARGFKQKEVAVLWPSATGGLTGCVANWELGFSCPKWDQWLQLKQFIGFDNGMDAEVWRLNGRKGTPGDAWYERAKLGEQKQGKLAVAPGQDKDRSAVMLDITSPATDTARQWQGFGTALKPSHEPLVLARKPLIGTVAENVLAHGTGAINVDGCRVEGHPSGLKPYTRNVEQRESQVNSHYHVTFQDNPLSRWPANVIHDGSDEVEEAFAAFGEKKTGNLTRTSGSGDGYGFNGRSDINHVGDLGTSSRFFYTAKADTGDRLGSKHPTVKPLDLIQYFVRLITPPGGAVLDLFAGTGTTGEAAFREGMRAILIEREAEYQADIERRMGLAYANDRDRKAEADRVRNKPRADRYSDTGSLF